MKTVSSTSGYLVEEVEIGVDTEDLELVADQWALLADAFADGQFCEGCMYAKKSWNVRRLRRERECDCQMPELCPAVNDRSIPAYLRRQAE